MTKTKKEFTFPPEEEIQKVIKRMIQPGYRRINKLLSPQTSEEDKVKHRLCKSISIYCDDNHVSEKELTYKLKIDLPKVEHILFCHINKLTLQELIDYVTKLKHSKIKYEYQTTT